MEKLVRVSSSRTELFKAMFIIIGVGMAYTGYNMFENLRSEHDLIVACLLILTSIVLVFLGTKLSVMKHYQGKFEFYNFLGKKIKIGIDDIKVLETFQFRISVIDPLGMGRFSIVKFTYDGKEKNAYFLNASRMSSFWDMRKFLAQVYEKRADKGPDVIVNK